MKIMKGKKAFLWKVAAALIILALFAVPVFATFPTYADDGGAAAPAGDTGAAPAADAPAADAPAADAPAADAPAVEAPAVDAPAADAPAADAPAVEAPAVDAPVADAPAVDAPAADAPAGGGNAPAVTTNASDYAASETPVITVSYLAPNTETNITVTAPDGTVTDMVATTDANGNATITYAPEGGLLQGEYTVAATDGTTTVNAVFTDASIGYNAKQWANDALNWTNGALQKNNSTYAEGDTVPFYLEITSFSGSHTVTITYDFSRYSNTLGDDIGGYDYLTGYNSSLENPTSPDGTNPATWTTDPTGVFTYKNATLTIDSGPTLSGTKNKSGSYDITLGYTGQDTAYVLWGGHLAKAGTDPDGGGPLPTWTYGVSDIPGGPIHMDTTPGGNMALNPGAIVGYVGGGIEVLKTGPDYAHIGDTITYTYDVFNAGDRDYTTVEITDAVTSGIPTGVTISGTITKTGGNGNSTFEPEETWTFTGTYTVTALSGDWLDNTATATASKPDTTEQVKVPDTNGPPWWHWETVVVVPGYTDTASDSFSVDILHDYISVTKTLNPNDSPYYAHVGDTVNYQIKVWIPEEGKDTPLHGISQLSESLPGITLPSTPASGDANSNGILDYGETWVYNLSYVVKSGDDNFTNTITVKGLDASWGTDHETPTGLDYDGFATATGTSGPVDVLYPGISVTKTGPKEATEGDTIDFTIEMTNDGDTPLDIVAWLDSLKVTVVSLTGDVDNDGWLGLNEKWTLTLRYVVQAADVDQAGLVTNRIDVFGQDLLGGVKGSVTQYSSCTLSVTVTTPTPPPGAALATVPLSECPETLIINLMGTVAGYPVKTDCTLCEDVAMTSPDGSFVLNIPQGTQMLNSDGSYAYTNPGDDIVGTFAGTPAAPSGATIVRAYQLSPNGIVFKNHNATLAAKYNPADVPQGSSLIWAYYDDSAGQWINMDTAGYVAGGVEVPDTLATTTAHLTYFAILATSK